MIINVRERDKVRKRERERDLGFRGQSDSRVGKLLTLLTTTLYGPLSLPEVSPEHG